MLHVLIADDEPQIVTLLAKVVESLGWTYDTVSNGIDAMTFMAQSIPDLVISDVNMPRMGGVDIVRHMKNIPKLSAIPIILMSSSEAESEAIASGCTAFIPKPFNILEVTRLLSKLTSNRIQYPK